MIFIMKTQKIKLSFALNLRRLIDIMTLSSYNYTRFSGVIDFHITHIDGQPFKLLREWNNA